MKIQHALTIFSAALLVFASAAPEPVADPEPAADPKPYLVPGFGSPLINGAVNGFSTFGAVPQLVYTQNGNMPLPSNYAINPIVPASNANTVSKTTTVVSGPAVYPVSSVPVVSPVTTFGPNYGSYLPVTGVSPTSVTSSSAAVASAASTTAASASAATSYVDPSIYSGYIYGINPPYTGLCSSCLRKKRSVVAF